MVATPIGNLADLSDRARDVLATVDLTACEDTRRTGRLYELAGVARPRLLRVDDHTEADATVTVLDVLAGGGRVALVSDAGTPGVADPGERLIGAVIEAGHPVVAVPGPSAVLAALAVSGLPTGRFVFEGFLPRKGRDRARRLAEVAGEPRTVVLYESPQRLAATLGDLAAACGPDRQVAVARELTKLHEQVVRGPVADVAVQLADGVKGEVVVVVGPAPPPGEVGEAEIAGAVRRQLADGASTRDAAAAVATELDVPKRVAYDVALRLDREI